MRPARGVRLALMAGALAGVAGCESVPGAPGPSVQPLACRPQVVGEAISTTGRRVSADEVFGAASRSVLGTLRYEYGVEVRFSDPRLSGLDRYVGAMATARNRCGDWITWDIDWKGGPIFVGFRTIAAPTARAASQPLGAEILPPMRGFVHVQAAPVIAEGFSHVGVWRAASGRRESIIAALREGRGQAPVVLARVPLRLAAASTLASHHGGYVAIDLVTLAEPGEPTVFLRLAWSGEAPGRPVR